MQKLELFQTTNVYTNVAPGRAYSSALELHERVLSQLSKGVTIFSFAKKDGEVRHAIGTLNRALIPSSLITDFGEAQILGVMKALVTATTLLSDSELPAAEEKQRFTDVHEWANRAGDYMNEQNKEKTERKKSTTSQQFFDLEAMQWKAYTVDNLLSLLIPGDIAE